MCSTAELQQLTNLNLKINSSGFRSSASTERKPSIKEPVDDESGLGELTVAWQEKKFSPAEIKFYSSAKEEEFHGDVLKMKFFRDVQVI